MGVDNYIIHCISIVFYRLRYTVLRVVVCSELNLRVNLAFVIY